jgi:hypothetical protein
MPQTETLKGHSWFLMMFSWEPGADVEAEERFIKAYKYLDELSADDWRDKLDTDDPRLDLDSESLRALNLIGRRKFVVIGQSTSNRVLQELALKVGLGAPIKVEVFPATFVHDLYKIMPSTQATT